MLRALRSALAVVALAACSTSASGGGAPDAQPQPCPPEDTAASDGTCIGPGVPPDGCDPGFTYDANGGCDPVLPPADCGEGEMAVPGDTECYAVGAAGDPPTCPPGQMALPGETACHGLADCGSAPWGDIPVDATTQYVDGSYAGGASDGTAANPWTTIGAAVAAASPGGIVAVAAGSYAESVMVSGSAVRLWGRCPSMVEIAGPGAAAVTLGGSTDGTEIHTIALTGAGLGASFGSAAAVLVDAVWVHDTAGDGLDTSGSATVRGSLFERATTFGLGLDSGNVSIDASVVRDTAPASGGYGFGLGVVSGSITVTGSVFERNADVQLEVLGSDATIVGCVIRDALPNRNTMADGEGLAAQFDEGSRPRLTVLASTLERNAAASIVTLGGDAFIGSTLIRDTQAGPSDGCCGYGLQASPDLTSRQASNVTATRSLIERSRSDGAIVAGGSLTLDHCVVRDTLPQKSDGATGNGAVAQDDVTTKLPASLTVTGSLLERNRANGLGILGSNGTVSATLVRGTLPQQSNGSGGDGVEVETDLMTMTKASLVITGSVMTGNHEAGLACYGADVVMDRSVVSGTLPNSAGYGEGVYSGLNGASATSRGTLAVTRSLLADAAAVSLYVDHTDATISQTWIRGVTTSPVDGTFGDGLSVQGDATLTASSCRIESAARAGLSMFGAAQVTLGSTTVSCDAIPLDGEGQSSFTNGGDVVCSCGGSATTCQVVSSSLQPPAPIVSTGP